MTRRAAVHRLFDSTELTRGGKIHSLGKPPTVRHHRGIQLRDGLTAGRDKQKRQQGMDKTSTGPHQHPAGEPGRAQQVLPIRLTDRGRVFVEEALNVHVQQPSRSGALQGCEHQAAEQMPRNKVAPYVPFR